MTNLLFAAGLAFLQATVSAPAFEAASVKPAKFDDTHGPVFDFHPGGLSVTNGTLKGIIEMAFDVRDFQISGPRWIDSARYYISAKLPGEETPDRAERIRESRRLLEGLLEQRFQLKAHRETKELPVYVLAVAKSGARVKEAQGASKSNGIRGSCGRMTGVEAPMAILAMVLSRQLGRPVEDRTGLTGKYDFELAWTPEPGSCKAPADAPGPPEDGPSIFTAIQEQLGLKLESTKGPVEIVVIDHVEKPDEN